MVTMSVTATVIRATSFNKTLFRSLGLSSGSTASKEFGGTVDLSQMVIPQMPISFTTPDITEIEFAVVQVTGGTAKVRFINANNISNYIDLELSGTTIMSGVKLSQIVVLSLVDGAPFIECFGMGK